MEKPTCFFEKNPQGLSNAPFPKCFGVKVPHIHQSEYLQILLNLGDFEAKFEIFSKNENLKKFQIGRFQRIFVQNASEIVR